MPSNVQLRYEALAAAVERASRQSLLLKLVALPAEPLPVRIECLDGSTTELALLSVVLDGGELVCRNGSGESVTIPLGRVTAVWRRRLRADRALSLWLGMGIAGGAAGAIGIATAPAAAGALAGSLLAMPLGLGCIVFLQRWKAFNKWIHDWVLLFDRAAA